MLGVAYIPVGMLADSKFVVALRDRIGSSGFGDKAVEVRGSRTLGLASEIAPGTGNSHNAGALAVVPPGPRY